MAQSEQLTPPELAVKVCGMLRSAGIEHAMGGALALGFYAEPRGTYDLDLNVFVAAEEADEALHVLRDGGVNRVGSAAMPTYASREDTCALLVGGILRLEHGGLRTGLCGAGHRPAPQHTRRRRWACCALEVPAAEIRRCCAGS